MSRIFGFAPRGAPPFDAAAMAQALAKGRHPAAHVHGVGSGTIGSLGTQAKVITDGDISVATDGTLLIEDAASGDHPEETTLMLQLYRRLGLARALERVHGEFAAAIHDRGTGRLYLVRDRLGVKPLYYVETARGLAFSSQPSGLLAVPGIRADVSPRYVALVAAGHYRTFDNRPEESPFEMISQLRAGHVLEWDGNSARTSRYWDLLDEPDLTGSEEELAEQYRSLLLSAVDSRLRRADKPAFLLSGGMDSSSILASANYLSASPQRAYSAVYSDPTYDERGEIRAMLGLVEMWHQVAIDDPDVFGLVPRMVAAHDEPVATATWLSHFLVAEQAAKDGVSALFGGLGGDELNAGEYEYFVFHFADLKSEGRASELAHEIDQWITHHNHPIYRKTAEVAASQLSRRTAPGGRNLPDVDRLLPYAEALDPDFFELSTLEQEMDHPFRSHLKNRTYQDLFRETTPCCLRAEDRHADWLGMTHVDPFLDHRLVEFMFRVPGHLKIRDGVTKRLLRTAMGGILPEDTRTRVSKVGWNAPAHLWFAGDGEDQLLDLIHSAAFRSRGIYRPRVVARLLDDHREIVASRAPRENHMMFFWQLVNLHTWLVQLDEGPVANPRT